MPVAVGRGQVFFRCSAIVVFLLGAPDLTAQSSACVKCHPAVPHDRHSRMMQPASKTSVEGDFAQGKVVLHGSTYLLRESAGAYFITESDLSGKAWEHKIEYTLGNRRVQHYLTTLPDGRVVLIPAAWDNVARKWVHDVDLANPEESSGDRILIWNKTCYFCHVAGEQKNFDAENLSYRTSWRSLGVACENCHGPAKEHLARPLKSNIVNPAHLDPARSSAVCGQCHSLRELYVDGFQAGESYSDYFLPALEYRQPQSDDPAFWPDGRPRWFANDATALSQSQCFLKGGATCLTCHSQPHNTDIERNPQLRSNNNALCTGCHKAIGADLSAHTHHAPTSSGSSCIECHMPAVATGLKARIRDHSMSIPAPENTVHHNIPNACNLCHRDKDAAWAVDKMKAWPRSQWRDKTIRRADAFAGARRSDPESIPALLAILVDDSESPWIRANAAGYLGNFPDNPAAYDAVLHAFADRNPLVRATAATVLKPSRGQRADTAAALVPLLRDPVQTVRMSAGMAMVALGTKPFPGDDGALYEQAKELYRVRAALYSDDAGQQFSAGRFFFLAGDMKSAAAALRTTLKLDPTAPARYPLALSLANQGDFAGARLAVSTIPATDPQYQPAQTLLADIAAKEAAGGATEPAGADRQFLDGQVLFKEQYYQAALNKFDEALRASPNGEWAIKAQIARAICLEKLARTGEAEAAMRTLAATPAGRDDLDLQLAFVELLTESGRAEEARLRIDQLIAGVPNAALAYFWRAKVLLQLKQTPDAAAAAEESIRLQPDLPQAHNLLIRIYQMQGRVKEAAEQAAWLRDYQKRTLPK